MDGSPPIAPVPLQPLTIAVLAGGESPERPVSLQSGAACVAALKARGHRVVTVDPATTPLERFDWSSVDVVFLALHGTFGEDGGVQQILDRHDVVYTGSNADASRLAFSKSAAKERFRSSGVPTPEYVLIHETDSLEHIAEQIESIGMPLVIKPDAQGSSIGVSLVRNEADVSDAVSRCFYFDPFGLVERAIIGPEWTLGVIDGSPLPLIRIGPGGGHAFFDYEAKYQDDSTTYEFDDDGDAALHAKLTATGLAACQSLGTRGIARVDMLVDADGQPWVLEVNTIPGMTDHSLVPKAAAHAGLSMSDLCELAITRALEHSGREPLRRAS